MQSRACQPTMLVNGYSQWVPCKKKSKTEDLGIVCNCHVFRDTRRRLIQNTNQQHQSMQTMSCEQSKTEKIRVSDIGINEKSALSSINPRLFLHELSIFPSRRTALTGWNARRFESNPIIQMKVSCCFFITAHVSRHQWKCAFTYSESFARIPPIFRSVASPRGLTFMWWGFCGLCFWHEPTELAHSFFYSVLVSISVFMVLSAVFHSVNSSDNSPLSHSVLRGYAWAFEENMAATLRFFARNIVTFWLAEAAGWLAALNHRLVPFCLVRYITYRAVHSWTRRLQRDIGGNLDHRK